MAAPDICPNCGAEVPPKAHACPECGSCPETGWSEKADAGNLGLPEDDFNYEEFAQAEFGSKTKPRGITFFWWIVAALVCGLLILLVLH